jgi:cysteine desulfurase
MNGFENCIYLDHHATTPMDERVLEKMRPFFLSQFGNPASASHPFGWEAQNAVDDARRQIAQVINAHPTEIIFTSGATESTNIALKGLFLPVANVVGRHVVTSSIEHGATLSTISALVPQGVRATQLQPQAEGFFSAEQIIDAMDKDTAVVSLFYVQNEIGSIKDISAIARAVRERGALFHCDAAQALGRVPLDCEKLDVDMMSLSGHKVYGPKGIGCLYVRRSVMDLICPLIHGGGQEWQKRSGTLNVPGIVGMAEAFRIAIIDFDEENRRIKMLRDRLLARLAALDGVHVNGTMEHRVSGNLNVSFSGIDGEELMLAICKKVAVSMGSACSSSSMGKSRVLQEIGVPPDLRQASLRFGLGRKTTAQEIDVAADLVVAEVNRQRHKIGERGKLKNILRGKNGSLKNWSQG